MRTGQVTTSSPSPGADVLRRQPWALPLEAVSAANLGEVGTVGTTPLSNGR